MTLDELARSATDSLVDTTTPDTRAGLADLKRSSRRRTTARAAAAGVGLVAVLGGFLTVTGDDASTPDPAEPVVHNGALLLANRGPGLHTVVGGEERLQVPADVYSFYAFAFTRDGRELVYTSDDGAVVAHDVRTGARRELWDCGKRSDCFWALSPDGQRLALVTEDGVDVRSMADGTSTLLPTPERPGAFMSWSPDGDTLAVTGTSGIYTVTVEDGEVRRVAGLRGGRFDFPRVEWSPDGDTIAFVDSTPLEEPTSPSDLVERSYSLRLVGRDGEDLRTVQDLGVCLCLGLISPDIAWAPDGSGIAFTKVGRIRSQGAHFLDLETGALRQLSPDANGFLAWQAAVSD